MNTSDFDRLLDRYLNDQLSDSERLKFEAWMDVMKVHKDTDLVLSREDEQKIYQRIINSMTTPDDILKFTPALIKRQQPAFLPWMKAAAVIVLLITASVVLYYGLSQSSAIEVIVNADTRKVILNDGTLIWLGKGSVLKYNEKGSEPVRSVSLTGDAMFEVAKDAEHPFTIAVGDMKVTVLGTSFSIRTDLKILQLKVITGKVNLSSGQDKKGIDVFPNESITYTPHGKIEVLTMPPAEVAAIIANTQYDMAFRNTPMNEVFAKIEKKFDVTITVADSKMNDCRITGDFSDHSLADTMMLLSDMLELNYEIRSRNVRVTGTGCTL